MSIQSHSCVISAAAVAAAPVINIDDHTITGTRSFGETGLVSQAGVRLVNTGQLQSRINGAFSNYSNEWQSPVGGLTASDYTVSWVRVSGDSAAFIQGGLTESTKYSLGTTRDIYLNNASADNTISIVIDVFIWPAAGGAYIDVGRMTLQASNLWI